MGQQLLLNELGKERINRQAKNVILFLGDGTLLTMQSFLIVCKLCSFYLIREGMSIATVTAARIYKGQKQGKTGEEEQLAFERFPYTALAKVSNRFHNNNTSLLFIVVVDHKRQSIYVYNVNRLLFVCFTCNLYWFNRKSSAVSDIWLHS